jgi:hypothetical protein
MISAPDFSRRLARAAMVAVAACAIAACGPNEVVVEGQFPQPLMEPLPLTIGVWYTEEFAGHEFYDEAKGRAESSWIVRTGEAQVQMWDILYGAMFEELVRMKSEPGSGQMNQLVDAVLIPSVDELQYTIPAHTNVKVYEIWMRYRFDLVTTSGEPIADWTMTAYGKTPTAFLQSDEAAVNLAAVVALRDAGANFAANFTRVPAVQQWLAEKWGGQPHAPEGGGIIQAKALPPVAETPPAEPLAEDNP